jgi:hypothetical protein
VFFSQTYGERRVLGTWKNHTVEWSLQKDNLNKKTKKRQVEIEPASCVISPTKDFVPGCAGYFDWIGLFHPPSKKNLSLRRNSAMGQLERRDSNVPQMADGFCSSLYPLSPGETS